MRGKVIAGFAKATQARIIPAGAGKRTFATEKPDAKRDHPRGCGEKPLTKAFWFRSTGSSPRVRGKGFVPFNKIAVARIIPAGAGKRSPIHLGKESIKDHPRGCGEKN